MLSWLADGENWDDSVDHKENCIFEQDDRHDARMEHQDDPRGNFFRSAGAPSTLWRAVGARETALNLDLLKL